MGKIKKIIEEMKDNDSSVMKEFIIKVVDDESKNHKTFFTTVVAKTKDAAINKISEDYKNKPYSYYVI